MNKKMLCILTSALMLLLSLGLYSCGDNAPSNSSQESQAELQRIVSLHGSITETLDALGKADEIVGIDVTSDYPKKVVENATQLGHIKSIQIESLLALQPTLVIAIKNEIATELSEKIKEAGIELVIIEQDYSKEGFEQVVNQIAKAVHNEEKAKEVIETTFNELNNVDALENSPKVLFIYARGSNMLLVGGAQTSIDAIINFAGGQNAMSTINDFKPLTTEALIEAQPDAILLFDMGVESLGGTEGIYQIPGITETPAGKKKQIITMNAGLLSNFGPRIGEATHTLNKALQEIEN